MRTLHAVYEDEVKALHAQLCVAVAKDPKSSDHPNAVNAMEAFAVLRDMQKAKDPAERFMLQHTPQFLQKLHTEVVGLTQRMQDSKLTLMEQDSEAALVAIHDYKSEVELLTAQAQMLGGAAWRLHAVSKALVLCRSRADELSDTFASHK